MQTKVCVASVLLCLIFSSIGWAHSTGRWCSSSYCDMCNRLHLIAGHGQKSSTVNRMYHSQLVSLHKKGHSPPAPKIDSTPQFVVDEMLKHAFPTEEDTLCDIGCGDGRIVIAAAQQYGCKAIGIEIKKDVADLAARNVKKAGVGHLVKIYCGDARKFNFDNIDLIMMYLFPGLMEELQPRIFKARKIVSYSHVIPNVENLRVMVREKYPIYIWSRTGER